MHLKLIRFARPRQTVGMLYLYTSDDTKAWVTSELRWNANRVRNSCIPPRVGKTATYSVVPHVSPRFGRTLWVRGVGGRSEILIHAGNYVSDTSGCILVGRTFTDLDGDGLTDITHSQASLRELTQLVTEPVSLEISWSRLSDARRAALDDPDLSIDAPDDLLGVQGG